MKKILKSAPLTIGFAFFSMLFGAGNLIFPLQLGIASGTKTPIALIGFMLSAVLLPILGLIGALLYHGDYKKFFYRAGSFPGALLLFFCMLFLGPLIAMPRLITLSYEMIIPFVPAIPLLWFSMLFMGATFVISLKEQQLVNILGYIISPLLLISLGIIIGMGLLNIPHAHTLTIPHKSSFSIVSDAINFGYHTLDVIAALFFASIILNILTRTLAPTSTADIKKVVFVALKGGLIGAAILSLVYIGLSFLGAFYGPHITALNLGQLLCIISCRVLGAYGAFVMALIVSMACFSTMLGLTAVITDYAHTEIFKERISYIAALALVLAIALIPTNFGLHNILLFSDPIISIGYPLIISLVILNVLHKAIGFRSVQLPLFIVFAIACISYLRNLSGC